MTDGAQGFGLMDYTQVQRLIGMTDEMNRNMTKLVTDIEVLKLQVKDLQQSFAELEKRTVSAAPVSWQSWAGAITLLVAIVLLVLQVMK
jgi:hypothetical protein